MRIPTFKPGDMRDAYASGAWRPRVFFFRFQVRRRVLFAAGVSKRAADLRGTPLFNAPRAPFET